MTVVIGTFVVSLVLVLVSYWLFVVQPEAREKSSIVAKLKGMRQQIRSVSITRETQPTNAIDAMLARDSGVAGALNRLLVEADAKMTAGGFIFLSIACAVVAACVGWFVFRLLAVSVALAVLASVGPFVWVKFRRSRRLRMFEEQFPEAIDLIARALRAGHALTTGLGMVADEIPAPVGQEFKRLYDEQNFGMSLPEAMRAMAQRVPVLDARFFVTAVLTQREAGGNLSEVLDNLASVMRERFKLKRQIRVASAHGRISAWVLACLPPALAGILFTLSPNFMRVLWEDPWGVRLLLVAGTLQLIGTFVISRMVRIEY